MNRYEQIKQKLLAYGQGDLLAFYDELDEEKKEELLSQLEKIDLEFAKELYINRNNIKDAVDLIEPIEYVDKLTLDNEQLEEYSRVGEEIIKNGEFAFVTLAGGQGTRLGHEGPKGTFKLGITPDKSLFEIMCDRLKIAHQKYNVYIPWYIMTSRENNEDTINFFEENNYFNYPKDKVKFFKQEELPMFLENGKIILESKWKVKESADGHGGIFWAMHKNGIIKDMEQEGIRWVVIGGIDNVLLNSVDPIFLGITIKKGMVVAGKSVVKARPEEKVGLYCLRNGRPSVVEYSEITDEMAHMKDENGGLLYAESNTLCNLLSIDALKLIENEKLPYHTAFKKSDYIDMSGNIMTSDTPNAYKFETFLFDAFSKFEDMLIYRVLREEEFAPVKNKEGVDSPETARCLYKNYWKI